MKRSEMIKKLYYLFVDMEEDDVFDPGMGIAESVLDLMEDAGMLPPPINECVETPEVALVDGMNREIAIGKGVEVKQVNKWEDEE